MLLRLDELDGVEIAPNGEEVNQVMIPGACCGIERTLWCSRAGTFFERVYEPESHSFAFVNDEKSYALDASDALQITIGTGSRVRRVRWLRAIALAWVEAPQCNVPVRLFAVAMPPEGEVEQVEVARTIVWSRSPRATQSFVTLVGDAIAMHASRQQHIEPRAVQGATSWKPMKYAWRNAAGEIVLVMPPHDKPSEVDDMLYYINKDGWVWSPYTHHATEGVRSADANRRWVSLATYGSVWVDVAMQCTFDTPSPIHSHIPTRIPDRIEHVVKMLQSKKHTLASLCVEEGIAPSTMWDRFQCAAQELPFQHALACFEAFVPHSVNACIQRAFASREIDATTRVRAVVEVCDATFASTQSATWHLLSWDDHMGIVRLALVLHRRRAMPPIQAP